MNSASRAFGWTCALLVMATAAQAQTFVPGVVKREFFPNTTRAQVSSTNPPAPASTNFYSSWNVTDPVEGATSRFSGLVSPTTSGVFDFFLAADDDTDLYISTDANPTNKYLIAQENSWSAALNWNTPGSEAGIASQKNSATWTNELGVAPHAAGIALNAGTRYYLEVVQHNATGGGGMAVTMVQHQFGVGDGTDTVLTNTSPEATIGVIIPTPTAMVFTAAGNPLSQTNFPGSSVTFRASPSHNSQIPPRYQWLRNGVPIPNATNGSLSSVSFYSLVVSTNDNGAQFRCVAYVPGIGTPILTRTSTVATLTVRASGALTIPGRLKREIYAGQTQPNAGHFLTNVLEAGNIGQPTSVATANVFDVGTAGGNYGERLSGFFTPAVSANYVFFLTSSNESMLFVSTNDQPSGKRLVAHEEGYSGPRDWYGFGAGNGTLPTQKRSDMWTQDIFDPSGPPYAAGIPLAAGSRYYIEAIHWGGGPNSHLGATYATTTEVSQGLPLFDDPSRFTNNVISYTTKPVTIFNITQQPDDLVRFEGLAYTLQVRVQTDSEVNPGYQWRKNGNIINGAVSSNYSAIALVSDHNANFTVDITIPGVISTNSQAATLSVIQGVFAEGILRREFWTNAPARGITRQIVGANMGGFPDSDYTLFTDTLDISEQRDNNYIQRLSGFFVPPVTTNYVFFISCDDDSDLYISTDEQPANKYLIAQENVWSSARQWLTANGGGDPTLKRSDQFNGGVYAAGIPLNAGQRYYLEVVHREATGGDAVSATYKYIGEGDPPNGVDTRLTGTALGTPVPPSTQLGIVIQPSSVVTHEWQPVYFSAFATNDSIVPSTYQWRRSNGAGGMTNLPGITADKFGFVTSSSDNGAQFDCVIRAPGTSLVVTTAVATLTLQPGTTFVSGQLGRELWSSGVGTGIIEEGSLGPAPTNDSVSGIDFPTALFASAAMRIRGFFVPPVTTNYTFFISSDDTAVLFLSTNDQPRDKMEIAREEGFSAGRSWTAATSGDSSLKHSDTWSPDGNFTLPYAGGIWMTNGQRYYIEAIHSQTGGDENFSVTYMMGVDPANYPLTGDASIMTNGVIGYMQAPVVAHPPVLTATRSGNTLSVSWAPGGGTLQSTPSLSPATWTPVGAINPTNITIGPGNLFLRVVTP